MPITDLPRLMVAAASSGSGKTTVVCTLLELLRRRSCQAAAFKSGPDYIDPMFHRRVLDTPSYNLDLFLLGRNEPGRETACRILGRHGRQKEIAILEGAMGYYDGIGMGSEASAYELASATGTPVVLVVDGRGSALTLAAVLKGMAAFRKDSRIAGAEYLHPVLETFLAYKLFQAVDKIQIPVFTQQDFNEICIFINQGIDLIKDHSRSLL